jgi:hypothetical protein
MIKIYLYFVPIFNVCILMTSSAVHESYSVFNAVAIFL